MSKLIWYLQLLQLFFFFFLSLKQVASIIHITGFHVQSALQSTNLLLSINAFLDFIRHNVFMVEEWLVITNHAWVYNKSTTNYRYIGVHANFRYLATRILTITNFPLKQLAETKK